MDSTQVDNSVRTLIDQCRRLWTRPNWTVIKVLINDGQIRCDPDGVVRFRGDRLTRSRFRY